jgi:hypothetical protein
MHVCVSCRDDVLADICGLFVVLFTPLSVFCVKAIEVKLRNKNTIVNRWATREGTHPAKHQASSNQHQQKLLPWYVYACVRVSLLVVRTMQEGLRKRER